MVRPPEGFEANFVRYQITWNEGWTLAQKRALYNWSGRLTTSPPVTVIDDTPTGASIPHP